VGARTRAPRGGGLAPARARAADRGSYPGKIRIIGGTWRSRRLTVPFSEGLRPTPDRVRETLFNWLAPYLAGARCLDLFAGTGALCLEALSRGAGEVVMIERAAPVADALRRNLEILGAPQAQVVNTDATEYLQRAPQPFDIVFLDPPFQSDLIARCAPRLAECGWVRPGGLVYIEAPSSMEPLPIPADWELIRTKKAGQVGYHLARLPG
jgi:16S rRNA (guanine966-N2)-methyltransferase